MTMVDAAGLQEAYPAISVNTWRHWRKVGQGPPSYKVNGRVLYDLVEVETWLRSKRELVGGAA